MLLALSIIVLQITGRMLHAFITRGKQRASGGNSGLSCQQRAAPSAACDHMASGAAQSPPGGAPIMGRPGGSRGSWRQPGRPGGSRGSWWLPPDMCSSVCMRVHRGSGGGTGAARSEWEWGRGGRSAAGGPCGTQPQRRGARPGGQRRRQQLPPARRRLAPALSHAPRGSCAALRLTLHCSCPVRSRPSG